MNSRRDQAHSTISGSLDHLFKSFLDLRTQKDSDNMHVLHIRDWVKHKSSSSRAKQIHEARMTFSGRVDLFGSGSIEFLSPVKIDR